MKSVACVRRCQPGEELERAAEEKTGCDAVTNQAAGGAGAGKSLALVVVPAQYLPFRERVTLPCPAQPLPRLRPPKFRACHHFGLESAII